MFPESLSHVPTHLEGFSIASRRLTDKELEAVAYTVADDCRVWLDDRRNWANFDQYLGFKIGCAMLVWQIQQDQMPQLVKMCMERTSHIKQEFPFGDSSHNKI